MRDAPWCVKEEAARSGGVGRSLIRAATWKLAAVTRFRTVPRTARSGSEESRAQSGVFETPPFPEREDAARGRPRKDDAHGSKDGDRGGRQSEQHDRDGQDGQAGRWRGGGARRPTRTSS